MNNFAVLIYGLFFLAGVLSLPMERHDLGETSCTKSGLMCESCDKTVMCIKVGPDQFNKSNPVNCPKDSTCLAGKCTTETNPLCDYKDLKFICQYQGAYPHPGDWTKYIFCVPDKDSVFKAYTITCEPETGYNPLTTYCNKNLKKIDPSTFPIPRCVVPHDVPVALAANPSIYYFCTNYPGTNKLYPLQSTCPMGGVYSGGECHIILKNN